MIKTKDLNQLFKACIAFARTLSVIKSVKQIIKYNQEDSIY